jgi:rRNA-processing protein FCF1
VSDGRTYGKILTALNDRKKQKNNPNDALIAEAVIKNGYALVSADCALCDVVHSMGGKVVKIKHKGLYLTFCRELHKILSRHAHASGPRDDSR